MSEPKFVLGLDYGTNSVRALIVNVSGGDEIATYMYDYKQGRAGIVTDEKDANIARQDPADYVEGTDKCVKGALEKAGRVKGFSPENIIGIGVDTTGSTPIPVDRDRSRLYARLFKLYRQLHDVFGTRQYSSNLHHVMKELLQIKQETKRNA